MFKVVEYPSSVPTQNLENSYIKQTIADGVFEARKTYNECRAF